jgi:hypothetical protein
MKLVIIKYCEIIQIFNLNNNIIMNKITILGVSVIFFYSLIQILKFYGVDPEIYNIYIYFYVFIIISIFILPNDYPKL